MITEYIKAFRAGSSYSPAWSYKEYTMKINKESEMDYSFMQIMLDLFYKIEFDLRHY
jgi:hypothetical protein